MDFFNWNSSFELGIEVIDSQHRELVRMINELDRALRRHTARDILSELLDELIDYSKYHFSTEEKYMLDFEFEGFSDHRKEHDHFRFKVFRFQREYIDGTAELDSVLMQFLKEWLSNHMLGTDRQFRDLFLGKGLR